MAEEDRTLDFTDIYTNLAEARLIMRRLQGDTVKSTPANRQVQSADRLRDLRRLEDLFSACRTLVNNEMWATRGFADMLGEIDG